MTPIGLELYRQSNRSVEADCLWRRIAGRGMGQTEPLQCDALSLGIHSSKLNPNPLHAGVNPAEVAGSDSDCFFAFGPLADHVA